VEQMFKAFQKPDEADKLTKIQTDLDEVTEILNRSLQDILRRGENLETLLLKSDDLSTASAMFRKKAEENNSCFKWLQNMLGLNG
jgi:synaptobrevin family protein YKT6